MGGGVPPRKLAAAAFLPHLEIVLQRGALVAGEVVDVAERGEADRVRARDDGDHFVVDRELEAGR